jgi:hypothetical protein
LKEFKGVGAGARAGLDSYGDGIEEEVQEDVEVLELLMRGCREDSRFS